MSRTSALGRSAAGHPAARTARTARAEGDLLGPGTGRCADRPDPDTHPAAARRRADRGQAAIEYAGVITLLLFVALAAIQLGL
ncbi:hypothetical protein ACWF94_27095, partial [Streptomyces sp. NPDC055078]